MVISKKIIRKTSSRVVITAGNDTQDDYCSVLHYYNISLYKSRKLNLRFVITLTNGYQNIKSMSVIQK